MTTPTSRHLIAGGEYAPTARHRCYRWCVSIHKRRGKCCALFSIFSSRFWCSCRRMRLLVQPRRRAPSSTVGAAAYNANDADAAVKLYAPDGLLHGTSSPTLNAGTSAISEYFKALPGSGNSVTIGDRHMVALGDAAAMGVGFYEFKSGQGAIRPPRFTFVVVKRGADWLIAHHHSSVLPAARP